MSFEKKPTVSNDGASGVTPAAGVDPVDGLKAATPQYPAGRHTDPTVWVPSVSSALPTAMAAADPLLDPPRVWRGFVGLTVSHGSVKANSVVLTLPRIMQPARRRLSLTVASAVADGAPVPCFLPSLVVNPPP